MTHEIRSATFPEDSATVQQLFAGYLEFLFERSPEERENITRKYDPARIPELVREFARTHTRPKGDILIARIGDQWAGCGMIREQEPGIAEIQRVFVNADARGHGLGKALTNGLVDRARQAGYRRVRLDTGHMLSEAIGLYESLGFRRRSPYHADTPQLDHLLVFFELEL